MEEKKTDKKENREGRERGGSALFFSRQAVDRLQSPEDMEKYLRVSTPDAWVMIIACAVLLCGFLSWAVFGSIGEKIPLQGVFCRDEYVIVFADPMTASRIDKTSTAYIQGNTYPVDYVIDRALTEAETIDAFDISQMTATLLRKDNREYAIRIVTGKLDIPPDKIIDVTITVDQRTPLDYVMGK